MTPKQDTTKLYSTNSEKQKSGIVGATQKVNECKTTQMQNTGSNIKNQNAFSVTKKLDELIKQNKQGAVMPTLLLHTCCGPCASSVLERLAPHFDITLFYYNPCISPNQEFIRRLDAIKLLLSHYPSVKLLVGEWENDEYLSKVKGYESAPEGGERCEICFSQRLKKTAELAKDFDYFATTLTVSPHKNAPLINKIGEREALSFGSNYLASDFKKQNGYLRSIVLSKKFNLYRQTYCGCLF